MDLRIECKDLADDIFCPLVDKVREAMQRCSVEVDMACFVKKWLDQNFGPYWTVIIGNSYGVYLTYFPSKFAHFYIGQKAVVVFQAAFESNPQ